MTRDDVMRDTMKHVNRVGELLSTCAHTLILRAVFHDESKFSEEEFPAFAEHTPALAATTYGSEEYHAGTRKLGPALEHHKKVNRHHPEYFEAGIRDMTLVDVLEMLCDWKAASERHEDGDILRSININAERFGISDDLARILRNTVAALELEQARGVRR